MHREGDQDRKSAESQIAGVDNFSAPPIRTPEKARKEQV
jgi:hypothetical protein